MGRIILADPSALSRMMVVKALENLGHHIDETTSGQEAVNLCIEAPPDCLVLELVLDEMDGLKVLKALKDHQTPTPIVVVTDVRMRDIDATCRTLGAAVFVRKPISPLKLKETVQEVIAARHRPAVETNATLDLTPAKR